MGAGTSPLVAAADDADAPPVDVFRFCGRYEHALRARGVLRGYGRLILAGTLWLASATRPPPIRRPVRRRRRRD